MKRWETKRRETKRRLVDKETRDKETSYGAGAMSRDTACEI